MQRVLMPLWAWLPNMFGRNFAYLGGYIRLWNKHVLRWLILKLVLLFIQLARVDYYLDFFFCVLSRAFSHSHYSGLWIGRRRWQDWKMQTWTVGLIHKTFLHTVFPNLQAPTSKHPRSATHRLFLFATLWHCKIASTGYSSSLCVSRHVSRTAPPPPPPPDCTLSSMSSIETWTSFLCICTS